MTTKDKAPTADVSAVEASSIPGVDTASRSSWNPSTGPIGASRSADHQYSFSGVGPYPGVTGILDVLHKQALIPWAKRTVAEYAVSEYINGNLGRMIGAKGSAETAKHLASLPDYQKNTAASLGTAVHHLADLLGRDRKPLEAFGISEKALPYAQAFAAFLGHYSPSTIISSEKMVFSISPGYGGTYDLIMLIDEQLWLIDIKTGKGPRKGWYPEVKLQLAGYAHADGIMLPGNPHLYPMPLIQRYGVLHLRPDAGYPEGWSLIEIEVTDRDFFAFMSAWDLWHWRNDL